MMSFERTPSGAALDPGVTAELRGALTRAIEAGSHGDELKGLLSRAAADARMKGMQAEQLLICLKDLWYSLPPMATSSGDDVRTRLLQQLIARCIQEYYAS